MIKEDYIFGLMMTFYAINSAATKFLVGFYKDYCAFTVEQSSLLEAAPVLKYLIQIDNFNFITHCIVILSMVVVVYIMLRKHMRLKQPLIFGYVVIFLCLITFFNMLNDVPILLGTLIKYGMIGG